MAEQQERILEPRHLGDGLYVKYDGYQIEIRVNDHRNPVVAALDPHVMDAMVKYINEIKEYQKR